MAFKQDRNDELMDALRAEVQFRYEPNFAQKSVASLFLAITSYRAFWPMSSVDHSGNTYDLSGQGRTLIYNGTPAYNYDGLAPYIDFDGTNDYLDKADEAGLDILGTETYVAGAVRGLTMGGWFMVNDVAPGANAGLIGKYNDNGVNQRSYVLIFDDGITAGRFIVSGDGTAVDFVDGATLSASTWYFLVVRYTPSTEIKIWTNSTTATNVVGIPASLFNSTADFNVGAYSNGLAATRLDGRASMCFLCAAALSDAIVGQLFQQSRAMFGV